METTDTASSIKILEDKIIAKRKEIGRNNYAKSVPLAEFYDREKLAFLEPILNVLKDIQTRLDVLEKRTNPSP
jgi:hypothetical protein